MEFYISKTNGCLKKKKSSSQSNGQLLQILFSEAPILKAELINEVSPLEVQILL